MMDVMIVTSVAQQVPVTIHTLTPPPLLSPVRPSYPPSGTAYSWTLRDPRGATLGEGEVEVGDYGSFVWSFELPDNCNTGAATLTFAGHGITRSHVFDIQEFRKCVAPVCVCVCGGVGCCAVAGICLSSPADKQRCDCLFSVKWYCASAVKRRFALNVCACFWFS